jgi:hypothetical protein
MRVLAACECSGVVREAFRALGHDAWSCDLLPTDDGSRFHFQGDVRELLKPGAWDLMACFPPCTHLAVSGAKHWAAKRVDGRQDAALDFVRLLLAAPVPRIALENPVGLISTAIRKPEQIVQPYFFGDPFTKTTCLWLRNLPLLTPTNMVDKGRRHVTKSGRSLPEWYNLPPGPNRVKIRSATFPGLAKAMADQWGNL